MMHALTIDVEDYFQVSAFEHYNDRRDWDRFELRVETNTRRLLEILDEHAAQATFFVLGWVAQRLPGLVREIHARGHEIGSHSYWHRLVYRQTPEEFREDVRRSRDVLQEILGTAITAYRAPSFSIIERSRWALDVLAEEGFRADSSIFPVHHDRYGIAGAPRQLHEIESGSGRLWEFPPSVFRWGGLNLPAAGGGYFRLLPLAWTVYGLRQAARQTGQPCMFYLHPWEIDPGQPRLNVGSRTARLRHYVNLRRTEPKLRALLSRFRFGRMGDVIRAAARATETGTAPLAPPSAN